MTTTFITGDRSNASVYFPLVAIEMMRALAAGNDIATGDSEQGVDRVVREFGDHAGVEVFVVPTPDGDFDTRNANVCDLIDWSVVLVHSAPEKSRAIASLLQDDDTRLVTHMDLLV